MNNFPKPLHGLFSKSVIRVWTWTIILGVIATYFLAIFGFGCGFGHCGNGESVVLSLYPYVVALLSLCLSFLPTAILSSVLARFFPSEIQVDGQEIVITGTCSLIDIVCVSIASGITASTLTAYAFGNVLSGVLSDSGLYGAGSNSFTTAHGISATWLSSGMAHVGDAFIFGIVIALLRCTYHQPTTALGRSWWHIVVPVGLVIGVGSGFLVDTAMVLPGLYSLVLILLASELVVRFPILSKIFMVLSVVAAVFVGRGATEAKIELQTKYQVTTQQDCEDSVHRMARAYRTVDNPTEIEPSLVPPMQRAVAQKETDALVQCVDSTSPADTERIIASFHFEQPAKDMQQKEFYLESWRDECITRMRAVLTGTKPPPVWDSKDAATLIGHYSAESNNFENQQVAICRGATTTSDFAPLEARWKEAVNAIDRKYEKLINQ